MSWPQLVEHTTHSARWCIGEVAMKKYVARLVKYQSGATAIEYGLIAALLGVGIITAAMALGTQISATFNSVATNMK
jgi:pilus assembly protein Flp/PilA